MTRIAARTLALMVGAASVSAIVSSVGHADSPPVGAIPAGPTSTIQTQPGQLVAFALPQRSGGSVWRIARSFDTSVVNQVSEATVGKHIVLIFTATAPGTATVTLALTRGETAKAVESRRFIVRVH